ncbi:MAG: aminopeptidase P family protein [Parvularculaceae bacterium]|nr:aminopeptidase P family protein [Parvularculaceae bacterium]
MSLSPAPPPISAAERQARLTALRGLMAREGADAVLLGSTSSLRYFTGVAWSPSERLTGAIVHADRIDYVTPRFELEKVSTLIGAPGEILTWQEEEDPFRLVSARLKPGARLALDEHLPLFMYRRLAAFIGAERLLDAGPMINSLRRIKSGAEIALMTHAKQITLEVHRRAWASLEEGVMASEVARFIDGEHRRLGAPGGSSFCIVAFGEDTSLPHGPDADRALRRGDIVLIDTGCRIDGYNSDITRTYAFGEATAEMRRVWNAEKEAQAAAFAAARPGVACEAVDAAARQALVAHGFGPGYALPGCPHRTGHGVGLDIHEAPNLVRGDRTPLAAGMCFSNEPMIVLPGRFGIRHEDHFYMTATGPRWFTEPARSLDSPFG